MATDSPDLPAVSPLSGSMPPAPQFEPTLTQSMAVPPKKRVGNRYLTFLVLAQFGVFAAFITPLAISLAIRLSELAPAHEEYLGYITGAGAVAVLVSSPILGVLSDRTRSRFGRRRPFMIAGVILGVISLFVMGTAPSVFVLGLGWVLAQLGWGQVLQNLTTSMADQLPESQRGKAGGLIGFVTQIAPVAGVIIASQFTANSILLFVIPGILGVLTVVLFVVFTTEKDTRNATFDEKLTASGLLKRFLYNPRQFPDFSINWLGRALFYFGLTLNTTFTAFFFAARLNISITDVAGIIATLGLVGILATTVGAIGGGFLSDRLKRRRVFVLAASIIFAAGAAVMGFSNGLPLLIAGSLLMSVGIGTFAAVDQALILDVLPIRETDAGRFTGINQFATTIPQAIAPFIAPLILTIGVSGSDKNYTLLYLIAGAITIVGGVIILRIKSVR